MLTQQRLKELLEYDPETGIFKWKVSKNSRAQIGSVAGSLKSSGYIQLMIDKKQYSVHRLAWLYVYGYIPVAFIDHINGCKDDNRIVNLREATNRQNQQNQIKHRNGKLVGAIFHKKKKIWESFIRINRKLKYLGAFKTQTDAHNRYIQALGELVGLPMQEIQSSHGGDHDSSSHEDS